MKQFFTLAEILAARSPELPDSTSSLKRLARGWRSDPARYRKAGGREGGGGFEYHLSVLPPATQARLTAIHSAPANDDRDSASERRTALWARFEALPNRLKRVCEDRLKIIDQVEALTSTGTGVAAAIAVAAGKSGVSAATIHNWRRRTRNASRQDRLAALAPDYKATAKTADCDERAWAALKADYLRPERPGFSACYRRMTKAAREHGWSPVPTERSLRRRLDREVPQAVQLLAREGRDRAKTLYPAQRRTRTHLHAMSHVNMDGHRLDVFVALDDGRVARPHLLAIQDLYSGKIVAWRLSDSENKETVRLAIGDMVERFGIPEKITLDNGRAFASKWISGGTANRFRFKVRDEDPRGLLTTLGVEISWTTPYSGQSKPIERAFRDLADDIARHPLCAGAYTGNRPDAKPENYGTRALPLAAFRDHVARGIAEHNARAGRRSKVCGGRSFDQAFEASMADPATLVKWPTEAQRSLWLLAAERIRAQNGSGEIHLFGNRYWAEPLNAHTGRNVTVRFDPDHLTRDLKVYDLDDRFICEAPCIADTGFDDVEAARRHARRRAAHQKAVSEQRRLHVEMSIDELADIYGGEPPQPEPTTRPRVVRLATMPAPAKAPQWDEEAQAHFASAMRRVAGGNVIGFAPSGADEGEPKSIGCGPQRDGGHEARREVKSRKPA